MSGVTQQVKIGKFLTKVSLFSNIPSQGHPSYRVPLTSLLIEDLIRQNVYRRINCPWYSLELLSWAVDVQTRGGVAAIEKMITAH